MEKILTPGPACPICGKPSTLYWLHTRAQFSDIPGSNPAAKIRLKSKEHPGALPVYGCHDCGIYGKPKAKTEGMAVAIWKRRDVE